MEGRDPRKGDTVTRIVYGDTRAAYISTVRKRGKSMVYEPPIGGYGPWKITPPVRIDEGEGTQHLCVPKSMTQRDLKLQHEWAMERSDRKAYRPIKFVLA
jgi:hypothetical protein